MSMFTATRSLGAAGLAKAPATALLSWQEAYIKVEALAELQAAQQGAGRLLDKVARESLVESGYS